jgi:hypothetical protein
VPATYPFINAFNVQSQLPYQEADDFVVHVADIECGFSFTEPQNSQALKRFILNYPSITLVEYAVLEAFFEEMGGTLGLFTFTDNQGNAHPNTRFDMADITPKFPQPGQVSVIVKLASLPN